jgi:hypothetical protein
MFERNNMIVMVGGSRDFNDYNLLKNTLNQFKISKLISGGARGADKMAEKYAKEFKIPIEVIKPEWNIYGKRAGMIRNEIMINKCEIAIFFWDGNSPGTKHAINYAKRIGKPYKLILYNQNSLF